MVNSRENRQNNGLSVMLRGTITGWPPRYDAVSVGGVQRREQCAAFGMADIFFFYDESIFLTISIFTYQHRGIGPLRRHISFCLVQSTALQVLCGNRVWGHIRGNRLSASVRICPGIVLQRVIDTRQGPFLNCHIL